MKLAPDARRVILFTGVAHAFDHAAILAPAPLIVPMCADLGTDAAGFGWIVTAMTFTFGLGALPAGFLGDRFGPRRVILVALVLAGVTSLVASFARTPVEAAVSLAGLGAALSLYHPCGLALITRRIPETERGRAIGYHGVAGSIGESLAPFAIAAIAGAWGGWRLAFRVLAVMAFALSAGAVALARVRASRLTPGAALFAADVHAEAAAARVTEATVAIDPHAAADGGPSAPPLPPEERPSAARVFALFGALVLVGFVYRAAITYFPKLLQDRAGSLLAVLFPSGVTQGGLFASVALSAGIPAQWLAGHLADRNRSRLEAVAALTWTLAAAFALLLGIVGGPHASIAAAFGFAFFLYAQQPATNALVARYTPEALRGRAYGISFSLSFGVGGLGAAAGGAIVARSDGAVGPVFLVLAGVAGLAALTFLLLAAAPRRASSCSPRP